jgi:hypothetical protein
MNAPRHLPTVSPARTSDRPAALLDDFLSHAELETMISSGAALRAGSLLMLRDGRRFVVQEALRVLGPSSAVPHGPPSSLRAAGGFDSDDASDPFGFTGMVETVGAMLQRGFVMSRERIALGRRLYDVEYGFVLEPLADPDSSGINPRIG